MMTTTEHAETLAFLAELERAESAPRRTGGASGTRNKKRLTNFFEGFSQRQMQASIAGGFAGGKIDRLNEDWNPGTVGPNRAFEMTGQRLRERAWDLYWNNPFATSAINAYVANVIERGISAERNRDWEEEWSRWGGQTLHATRECDLSEEQTLQEMAQTWLREVLVGGGCLTHYVTPPRRSRRIPLAIELISEERFADHVDGWGNNPKTRNPVVQGHEMDPASGKTIAYHVFKGFPNDVERHPYDSFETIRLSREVCEYAYMKERTRQKRGTTVLKSVVMWLWALGYYADNELAASQAKSAWAYMIKTLGGVDFPDLADTSPETGLYDVSGNRLEKLERGMVWRGRPGDEISTLGPNVPQADSLPWILMIQRSIAVGTKLSYEEVFRDYSKGSFSSVRMARGQDIKRYTPLQDYAVCHFYNPTAKRFDLAAVGALIPGFPSPAEYADQVDELFRGHEWHAPGWESPNPRDDALADDIRINNRTLSRTEVIGRRNGSWNRTRANLEREQRDMETGGILPPKEQAAADLAAGMQNNETGNAGGQG